MISNPCYKCPDRIVPTKEDPRTCHGNCKREAAFKKQEAAKATAKIQREREERELKAVWDGKIRRIKHKKVS